MILNDISSPSSQPEKVKKILAALRYFARNFLHFLNQTVEDKAFVATKVRVNDVLEELKCLNRNSVCNYGENIFDFVLYNKHDLTVLCVIELDDRPHPLQRSCPEKLYQSLRGLANLPLINIQARCSYEIPVLKELISPYLDMAFKHIKKWN